MYSHSMVHASTVAPSTCAAWLYHGWMLRHRGLTERAPEAKPCRLDDPVLSPWLANTLKLLQCIGLCKS